MCGIVGIASFEGKNIHLEDIKKMTDVIAHRGPDGAGFLLAQTGRFQKQQQQFNQLFTQSEFAHYTPLLPSIDNDNATDYLKRHRWDVFFGHRRLAILDTSFHGMQPFSDMSQKVWLTYNGEIYNFKEIRDELLKLGFEFYTETDTEVVLKAYKAWGIACVNRFNGMFAFALWDAKINHLFLARDRYGIKPLYYTVTPSKKIVFASEVKALLSYQDVNFDIDYDGLSEYLTFQNLFGRKTLYNNISLLAPGHYIDIDLNHQDLTLVEKQYWDFCFEEEDASRSEEDYCEELNALFQQAVNRHLLSDVEVGSYLSGGLDSGAITAISAKSLPYIKTFTVGFDMNNISGLELSFDEREKAELMSYLYKTEHYEMVLKSGDMERCLKSYAWHLEEPRVGQSYPNFYAAKLASKFVKVVLSGVGGDELFGGYPWRYYHALGSENFEQYVNHYFSYWQRLVNESEFDAMVKFKHKITEFNARDSFKNVLFNVNKEKLSQAEIINSALYFEVKTFLHGLLMVEDKLSMAHSLETRVPMLDNDLVDFAMRLPVKYKLRYLEKPMAVDENEIGSKSRRYYQRTHDGKMLLRQSLSNHLPSSILKASKQGFSSPDQSWFKGESIDFIQRLLMNQKASIYQLLNYQTVQDKINAHLQGKANHRLFIWSLINLEMWAKQHGV